MFTGRDSFWSIAVFFFVCWFLLSSLLLNGFLWGHSDKNNNHFSSQTQQRVVPVHHRSYGVIYLSFNAVWSCRTETPVRGQDGLRDGPSRGASQTLASANPTRLLPC